MTTFGSNAIPSTSIMEHIKLSLLTGSKELRQVICVKATWNPSGHHYVLFHGSHIPEGWMPLTGKMRSMFLWGSRVSTGPAKNPCLNYPDTNKLHGFFKVLDIEQAPGKHCGVKPQVSAWISGKTGVYQEHFTPCLLKSIKFPKLQAKTGAIVNPLQYFSLYNYRNFMVLKQEIQHCAENKLTNVTKT